MYQNSISPVSLKAAGRHASLGGASTKHLDAPRRGGPGEASRHTRGRARPAAATGTRRALSGPAPGRRLTRSRGRATPLGPRGAEPSPPRPGSYAAGRRPQTGSPSQMPRPEREEAQPPYTYRQHRHSFTAHRSGAKPPLSRAAPLRAHLPPRPLPSDDPPAPHRPPPGSGSEHRPAAAPPATRNMAGESRCPRRPRAGAGTPNMAPGRGCAHAPGCEGWSRELLAPVLDPWALPFLPKP
ncbi:translation initiation factor IF-2-like [Rissa tridactyla]|uniref:translation initiation factor IF-2-like n=1 Tax=Rissa tridactyla TaxID=75485 RepID=UPI0023BA8C7F|nr:translation initiation factor IF-2-like [Rissa tridactyla]